MKQTKSYREKIIQFLIVLLPIFVTQVTLVSTGFFDTVMSGNVSEYDLAGVAVGVNLFFPVFGSMLGIISGLTPTIAQLHGAGEKEKLPYLVVQGMYLAILLGLCAILLGHLLVAPILSFMALEPKVEMIAKGFLLAISFGLCPILVSSALRNFIDALGYTRVTMLVTICAVPINISMNYLFIFGKFGFPALGGIGAGVGTAITYWMVMTINILVVMKISPFNSYRVLAEAFPVSLTAWRNHLKIGVPIGSAMFCEQSIFGAVSLFMASYGTTVIAAHQAAFNFTTLIYMIPMSISMALTIMVGFEVGAKRYQDARRYSYLGILISVVFASSLSLFLINFKSEIAGLYTKDVKVFELIEVFLVYAIFLQLSDAVSAPMQGTLRGYKDVKVTLLLAIISYWIIGLPTGYVLANYLGFGPYGYWIGLIVGIAIGAVFLAIRLLHIQRGKFH